MKLLIHSQISTVASLKFRNGFMISSHTNNGCIYLSMLGIKLIHVNKRGPWGISSHCIDLVCQEYSVFSSRMIEWTHSSEAFQEYFCLWRHMFLKCMWQMTFIPWWRHQMETFSALLALCAGNSPVPVNSPHKGQWRGALIVSLIDAWINDWVNNREAGDLRRQRGHYDVIVMPVIYVTSNL